MTGRIVVVAAAVLGGCGRSPPSVRAGDLRIEPRYATASPTGDGGAAYLVVRNAGSRPDTLASVAVAGSSAHLHTFERVGNLDRMTVLDRPPVPAGGALVLEPGGPHLMFEGLPRALRIGDTIVVTLRFVRAGAVAVPLVVQPYGGP